jgi:hypothetical protein
MRRVVASCLFGAWLAATVAALAAMSEYASRPGAAALAPATWPDASRLPRSHAQSNLVMIAHTRCACTRASLHELERLMTRAGDTTTAFVVFVGPREPGTHGLLDVRDTARAIPNVRVFEDESEARLFGAATSGQVLLYDEKGALVFRGGITPSRGHEGTSVGSEALRRFMTARQGAEPLAASSPPTSDVFGCALFDPRTP